MKIIEVPTNIESVNFSEDDNPRSEGLHLSDILEDIEVNTLRANRGGDIDLNAFRTMGFIWERVLTGQLIQAAEDCGSLVRPGELEKDGIYMTPDGLCPNEWVLEEWKCTWKSMRREIEDFWRYWAQIKSYCLALDCSHARLRVFFVNGDYKGSGPRFRVWEAEFTSRELQENWDMNLNHGKSMGVL